MVIGHYQVKRELGIGGMATVYAAHDPMIGRDVAIKLMPRDKEDDLSFRKRFEREARTIAALEHIAIVPVYEFGEDHERPYLVMRLMSGGSLEQHLRSGPMPVNEITKILRRIGAALDKAHANHIVHRDIKPANILFDEEGEPYLSDFGIVKVSGAATLTATGGIIGTPAYMSPEQVRGQSDVDNRSDIYSLGALLFQMLSGRLPYESETAMGLALMHVTDPVPNLQDVETSLPSAYQTLISRAMAKDRDQRFQTANELAMAFDAATRSDSNLPIVDPTIVETVEEPLHTGSRRWLLLPGILLVVALSVAVAIWFNGSMPEPHPTPPAPEVEVVLISEETVESEDTIVPENTRAFEETVVLEVATMREDTTPEITVDTPVPEIAATMTSLPTSEPESTASPLPVVQRVDIGKSSRGQPLELTQVGNGPHNLLLLGGMRGDQPATRRLVQEAADYFVANPGRVPDTYTVSFLSALNPDALAIDSRYTPGGVDLNRNWQTASWVSNAPQPEGNIVGSGGSRPFSEPETDALHNWLLNLQANPRTGSIRVINYYHHVGVNDAGTVQPGYINYGQPEVRSSKLAKILSNSVGYEYIPAWQGSYEPTGEFLNWTATQEIASVDVELPPSRSGEGYTSQQFDTIVDDVVASVFSVISQ